jgi:hypothetical protein
MDEVLRIIVLLDFVHRTYLEVIGKHNVSEIGSLSTFRWVEGGIYSVGSLRKN